MKIIFYQKNKNATKNVQKTTKSWKCATSLFYIILLEMEDLYEFS